MKRFLGLVAFIIVVYVIYFDLTTGTLPVTTKAIAEEEIKKTEEAVKSDNDNLDLAYFEKEVKNGDTVLSIIESHLNDAVPVPIQDAVVDFKKLNNGLAPEKIQRGKTYKFPNYQDLAD
ncbi:hypothetical protein [Bacillus dakarensis]|jgi:hypothetical protein|uniref:hypothetical protein n=1 Tax=Robertmurraya dakarensis TaxID=1926278 RepID=UPI000981EA15|nr:hypothetical protein [Bacillus dakarensis]